MQTTTFLLNFLVSKNAEITILDKDLYTELLNLFQNNIIKKSSNSFLIDTNINFILRSTENSLRGVISDLYLYNKNSQNIKYISNNQRNRIFEVIL